MNYALISILLSCVFGASTAAIWCWLSERRLRKRFYLRTSAQLSAQMTKLSLSLDSISATVRRLSAREGMRAMRGRRAEAESSSVDMLPGETRAQWKERMRRRVFGNGKEE